MLHTITRADLLVRSTNTIDGQWLAASGGDRFPVEDPATLQVIGHVPDSGAADAQAAVDAAARALPTWRERTGRDRARLLKRWSALLLAQQEDLARIISAEQGKPLAESRGEVESAAGYIEWFAEEAARIHGELIPPPVPGKQLLAVREPVGIVAAITPWNFPLVILARKLAPALAAGCTTVAKPAEDTPLCALALAALAQEAGLPPGTVNVVCASRSRAAVVVDEWLRDPRVRKISFTGSTPVGKHLAAASGQTLKKLSLELGGNAPFIVFDDADLDQAVQALMVSKFRNTAQTCVCPNRVYVHAAVQARLVDKLAARMAALRVGPASDPQSQLGPLINDRALQKVERHVADAADRGARVLLGGHRVRPAGGGAGHYYAATLLLDARHDMLLAQEETFGPVVPVFGFTDEAEVVRHANDTPYGLAAYFCSRDPARIARVSAALESGVVAINEGAFGAEAAPFGGIKDSGYGREGSRHGLDEYQHIKYVCQGGLA